MQQIITGSYPRFIATAVGALLSIVTDIGHIPPAVVTEHRGTVVFMIVIGGSNHQPVFIRRLYGLVDLLHLFLCNLSRSDKGKEKTHTSYEGKKTHPHPPYEGGSDYLKQPFYSIFY